MACHRRDSKLLLSPPVLSLGPWDTPKKQTPRQRDRQDLRLVGNTRKPNHARRWNRLAPLPVPQSVSLAFLLANAYLRSDKVTNGQAGKGGEHVEAARFASLADYWTTEAIKRSGPTIQRTLKSGVRAAEKTKSTVILPSPEQYTA